MKPSYIYESMRPYQREGAAFAKHFLLADQPGLGKTIQTLASIVRHHRKERGQFFHLVLCPSVAVLNVWEPETLRWLKDHAIYVVPLMGTLEERDELLASLDPPPWAKHVFVIVNIESAMIIPGLNAKSGKRDRFHLERDFELLSAPPKPKRIDGIDKPVAKAWKYTQTGPLLLNLFRREWDTVVVDESHRALIAASGMQTATRAGMVTLGKLAGRRIALSGTPMRGKPEQLWGTLNWLRPDLYRSKWKWIKKYFALESNGFSRFVIVTDESKNAVFLPGARKQLADELSTIMLRRTKAEVLPDLPPKQYAGTYAIPDDENSPLGVWLPPTPKMLAQQSLFESDNLVWDEEDGEELFAQGSLAIYTRARFLASGHCKVKDNKLIPTLESPKFDWLLNWLDNADGEKIVVVSQFTSVLDVFKAGIDAKGYETVAITGRVSQRRRTDAIEAFQNGSAQVCFLNVQAGGVALTLDAADYLVFLDETTIPDDQEQAEDRIHRASRMHQVTIYFLRTLDSIEEEVAFVAAARASVQAYLLDGARGVESAKKLYIESKKLNTENVKVPGYGTVKVLKHNTRS